MFPRKKKKKNRNKKDPLSPSARYICVPVPEICLSFGWHVYIWQQISEVCMKELSWKSEDRRAVCPPSRNETAGLLGLQPSDGGEKSIWKSMLISPCLEAFLFLASLCMGFWYLLSNFPTNHQEKNASSGSQTSNKPAHSRCFVGQSSAGAKRTGREPTANMRGFESLVSKTHQKRLLCICCLHWPTSTFPASVNPIQPVPRTYSLKLLWSRFQTDLLSPDLVVTCLSTCLSTNQGLSSQWTTPSRHLPFPPVSISPLISLPQGLWSRPA